MTKISGRRRPGASDRLGAFGSRRAGRTTLAAAGVVMLAVLAACTSESGPAPGSVTDEPHTTTATTTVGTGLIPPDGASGSAAASGGVGAPAPLDGPPAAALLTWLDGAEPTQGVVTVAGGQRTWVGRSAGESATLGDGWYRYFGADGSAVGCTSAGACVGVADDDTIAVTSRPHSTREVYRTDGTYLGTYGADGDQVGRLADPPPLTAALAATKVDLAALVDAATARVPFAGGVTGDPHVVTMGGQRYSTQLGGQLMARVGDAARRIQVQLTAMPHRGDVSVVTGLAVAVGGTVIEFDADGAVTINGAPMAHADEFTQVARAGGVVVGRWPADDTRPVSMVVVWPDGGTVAAEARGALGLTVITHLARADGVAGLFGSAATQQGPDLAPRGGAIAAGGIDAAVASWVVPSDSDLFTSGQGPITGLSTAPAVVDPGAGKVAEKLCQGRGMAVAQDVTACAFDVAVTGDTGFIDGHVDLALAAESSGLPDGFARRWPAAVLPATRTAVTLPSSGEVSVTLGPSAVRLYRVTLKRGGPVGLVVPGACAAGATTATGAPAMDRPAWRLFDPSGHPASDRKPLCGSSSSGPVAAGSYLLAVANGPVGSAVAVRAAVTLP